MTFFFNALQQLENEKWKIVGDDKAETLYNALGTSRSAISDTIDKKFNYSHTGFITAEGKGETFLPACWDFLTFNLIFDLLGYCLLRLAFRLLFNYPISIFLRAYSFLVYLSPLLLEGNLQYFFFLMFSQGNLSFSLSVQDKGFTVLGALVYFLILWVSVVSCFIAYFLSRTLTKYVLDNWRTRIYGLFSFSLGTTLRMLVFGAIHSILRFDVKIQLLTLLIAEVLYIVLMCAVMKYWRSHKVEFKAWYTIFFAFLRVVLISVLFLQQQTAIVGTAID